MITSYVYGVARVTGSPVIVPPPLGGDRFGRVGLG